MYFVYYALCMHGSNKWFVRIFDMRRLFMLLMCVPWFNLHIHPCSVAHKRFFFHPFLSRFAKYTLPVSIVLLLLLLFFCVCVVPPVSFIYPCSSISFYFIPAVSRIFSLFFYIAPRFNIIAVVFVYAFVRHFVCVRLFYQFYFHCVLFPEWIWFVCFFFANNTFWSTESKLRLDF